MELNEAREPPTSSALQAPFQGLEIYDPGWIRLIRSSRVGFSRKSKTQQAELAPSGTQDAENVTLVPWLAPFHFRCR